MAVHSYIRHDIERVVERNQPRHGFNVAVSIAKVSDPIPCVTPKSDFYGSQKVIFMVFDCPK